jgi:hypothetical protein
MYDTGETKGDYPPMSIGWLNGFNHKTAPLPDTIEEIEKLLVTTGSEKELQELAVALDKENR